VRQVLKHRHRVGRRVKFKQPRPLAHRRRLRLRVPRACPFDRALPACVARITLVNRQARLWLAEILHGLITGNYRRVAEIHFDAQYVPPHHNIDEFTTALRAVGEPIRGVPVKDISVGNMLDGLFAITREFDMPTQPHLLLLQKTMVMVEGVASSLDPDINMWDVSGPFVSEWLRDELGPEAVLANHLQRAIKAIGELPDLLRRIEAAYPKPGAAPPGAPLPEIEVGATRWVARMGWALLGASAGAAAVMFLYGGL
jgi:ubiquinone biosynthesis protein